MTTEKLASETNRKDEIEEAEKPLPNGYRQGVITAISVILGFSLYFVRFWALEASGDWTAVSLLASAPIFLSVACLSVALWRSLQVADDNERVYRRTLKWFLWGILFSLAGVLSAAVSSTYADDENANAAKPVSTAQNAPPWSSLADRRFVAVEARSRVSRRA